MTAVLAPERIQKAIRVKPWTCRYCKGGACASCPGVVVAPRSGKPGQLWTCECGKEHRPAYCRECKNENVEEVNPETWSCVDQNVCYGRVRARQENNELWQMLQRCKSVGALERKRKRLMTELALSEVDPQVDAMLEQVGLRLLQDEQQAKKTRVKAPWQPKVGVCECPCGGATKGGKFIPGHDAKLASLLKRRVQEGDSEAYEEIKRRNWLKKLPAALRSEWENKNTN